MPNLIETSTTVQKTTEIPFEVHVGSEISWDYFPGVECASATDLIAELRKWHPNETRQQHAAALRYAADDLRLELRDGLTGVRLRLKALIQELEAAARHLEITRD